MVHTKAKMERKKGGRASRGLGGFGPIGLLEERHALSRSPAAQLTTLTPDASLRSLRPSAKLSSPSSSYICTRVPRLPSKCRCYRLMEVSGSWPA